MKLVGVTIENYKSFGEKDNFLFIDKLNGIIGKNESGKSNIIDSLASIKLIGLTDKTYFLPRNRKNNKDIKVKLDFETYKDETTIYGFKGRTSVTLEGYNNYVLSGEMSEFISNSKTYNDILEQINELKSGISFQQQETRNTFNKMITELNAAEGKIFVDSNVYDNIISSLKKSNVEKNITIAKLLEEATNYLENLYSNFPVFVKIEDQMLKSKYSVQNIENDELLGEFLEICNIDIKELVSKMNSIDIIDIKNYERDINNNIKTLFTDEFNAFYTQENVKIDITIVPKEIDIMVDTTNRYLNYDERSNGLKWYISAFIQLQYMNKKNCESSKNNVILMDEPGVYLHANAQKEVLRLFSDLIKNQNQIIYTTHSPFMIDTKTIQNIRAVVKDEEGFSHIYNKITNIPTNLKSTYDTITPLTNAMGLDLSYNIGPSFTKNNIIVEGITDYFYLQGYYKCKKEKNVPNIIPSTGANNVTAIASILFGWNCDFNILLDQDEKGQSIYDSINDSKQPFIDKVLFVDGTNKKIAGMKYEIESVFSEDDKNKFGINNKDYSEHKYNYAYITYNKILLKEETYDEETMKKFEELIEKLSVSN